MELSKLAPPKGARKIRKLVGRGEGSGHGKTCCRGGKGQTARNGGGTRAGFEGGQMPFYRRIPKFGFRSRKDSIGENWFSVINLDTLNLFNDGDVIDQEALEKIGVKLGQRDKAGIKVLGQGELKKRITLKVSAVSSSARKKIEAAGGKVELA